MLKTTKCVIAFNGWKALQDMKKITSHLKDKQTITEIKNLNRDIKVLDVCEKEDDPTDEELA